MMEEARKQFAAAPTVTSLDAGSYALARIALLRAERGENSTATAEESLKLQQRALGLDNHQVREAALARTSGRVAEVYAIVAPLSCSGPGMRLARSFRQES